MESSSEIKTAKTDVPLEVKMESLELNDSASSPDTSRRRSLRKRLPVSNKIEGKRRVTIKPKKVLPTGSTESSLNINQLYLCKKLKRLTPNLETIYEEPKISATNEIMYIGLQKKKRFLVFDQSNKGKIKKRKVKVKKVFGKNLFKNKHSTLDTLLDKLRNIE